MTFKELCQELWPFVFGLVMIAFLAGHYGVYIGMFGVFLLVLGIVFHWHRDPRNRI